MDSTSTSTTNDIAEFLIGIAILILALILSCFLGQYQQYIYSKYGKHWEEGLFYMHFLGLPVFLFLFQDIKTTIINYNESRPISLSLVLDYWLPYLETSKYIENIMIPEMWLYLALNTITQFICISGVCKLTSMMSSVSVNLILAIRKFVSLFLSIVIFKNEFTRDNWLGTLLVIGGSLMYSFF